MILIFHSFLELLNITDYPYRFYTLGGFGMILGGLLVGLPILFTIFYILRSRSRDFLYRYLSDVQLRNFRLYLISLSLTLTSFLAFLAFLIYFLLSLFVFNESWESFDFPFLLLSLLPFSFYFILSFSSLFWFLHRKKRKGIIENSSIES